MFYYANEKSSAARHREEAAKAQFDHIRKDVERVLHQKAIDAFLTLGNGSGSSHVGSLPGDITNNIVSYLVLPGDNETKEVDGQVVCDGLKRARIDKYSLDEFSQGSFARIPLSSPAFHLTRPCYRDFARYVRSFQGYHSSRVRVTGAAKHHYLLGDKHSIYRISIVFKLPINNSNNKTAPRRNKAIGKLHL
jgi:hypothetical protein